MGLTKETLRGAYDASPEPPDGSVRIALAGNPNVGKSTVFNALTGMHQHTGNWAGKTVGCAVGKCILGDTALEIADLPGTYSLLTRSAEEQQALQYLREGEPELSVVVCDACCLERNLNLALQVAEISPRTLVCVNLMDEAKKRRIHVDIPQLEKRLGMPVVGICARKKADIRRLISAMEDALRGAPQSAVSVRYPEELQNTADSLRALLESGGVPSRSSRFLAMRLLDGTMSPADSRIPQPCREEAEEILRRFREQGNTPQNTADEIVTALVGTAEDICRDAVREDTVSTSREKKIDRILTGRLSAFPIMLALLIVIFWITIVGANYPSSALSALFSALEEPFFSFLVWVGAPPFLCELLVYGMYRVLAWVCAVMLPPMAIFFPLFTLLEDVGYLPRIAYNLDRCFRRCSTCGKQALTMCMGFGCNAAGVVGCRIIDSPRERLIAILTNSFVPCNGRFPLLIAMASMFFVGTSGLLGTLSGAAFLAAVIVFCVAVTLMISSLLSKTVLSGIPSSFTLELPPYRRPLVLPVLVRSLLDRTLFVLGRAAAVAAPAGILIWILANVDVGGASVFAHLCTWLDPVGRFFGLDGVILIAFILGFPANETVIPIMMMGYLSAGTLTEYESLDALRTLLTDNGWTPLTAVCVILFSLMHWPCSTTLITVYKETKSVRWTALAFWLPTVCGLAACLGVRLIGSLFV